MLPDDGDGQRYILHTLRQFSQQMAYEDGLLHTYGKIPLKLRRLSQLGIMAHHHKDRQEERSQFSS